MHKTGMTEMKMRLSLLSLALFAAGCASVEPAQPTQEAPASPVQEKVAAMPAADQKPAPNDAAQAKKAAPTQGKAAAPAAPAADKPKTTASRIFPGDDKLFKRDIAPKPDPMLLSGELVSLNFENISVANLANALLGDLLKLNYTIDTGGDVVVSLHTRQAMPRNQVLDVLDTVLLPHDLAIVRDGAGVYHVTKRSVTVGSRPVVGSAKFKELAGAGTMIVPLNYIAAGEMAKILTPLAPRESIVYVDTMRNLLVLQGSKSQLSGWLEMVEAFDVDFLSGMSLGVFVLENASVNVVRDALQALLSSGTGDAFGGAAPTGVPQVGGAAGGIPGVAAGGSSGAAMQGLQGNNPLLGLIRVIPVERLNALVVVTPRSQLLSQVETWVRRLDRPMDALEASLFVYPVQNGSASNLAEMLNGLFGGGAAGGRTGVAAGSAPTQFGSGTAFGQNNQTGAASAARTATPSMGGMTPAQPVSGAIRNGAAAQVSQLDGNVRVVADEKRNALLIRAPRTEYRRIEQALRELDKAPAQVLIEASIVEVSLTGNLSYGVEWFFQNYMSRGREGQALLNLRTTGDIGAQQPGFSYSILNAGGTVRATLNALSEQTKLRVLSNPTVLVLDNHNATIQIGKQQPVKSSTTATGTLVTEAITYKDTGVMLSVTPSVNSGGLITMDIVQQVTDVGEIDVATGQRSFLTRQIQSRVAVRSGDPIVLGGMIRENETSGTSGVPLLSEIPVLGALFGKNTQKNDRTELLVLLTPRALENDDQLRAASAELRQRMRSVTLPSALALPEGKGAGQQ